MELIYRHRWILRERHPANHNVHHNEQQCDEGDRLNRTPPANHGEHADHEDDRHACIAPMHHREYESLRREGPEQLQMPVSEFRRAGVDQICGEVAHGRDDRDEYPHDQTFVVAIGSSQSRLRRRTKNPAQQSLAVADEIEAKIQPSHDARQDDAAQKTVSPRTVRMVEQLHATENR